MTPPPFLFCPLASFNEPRVKSIPSRHILLTGFTPTASVEGNITLKPGEGPAYCYSWASTSDPRVIPSFANTTCEADDAIVVSFQGDNTTGYTYAVLWKESEHSLLSGSYHVGADEFDYQPGDGGAQAAYYNGTNEFALSVSQQVVTSDGEDEEGE